jgi:phospholipid transport system substrate-binding protein
VIRAEIFTLLLRYPAYPINEVSMTYLKRAGAVGSVAFALAVLLMQPGSGGPLGGPGVVQEFYQTLLNVLRNGPALGPSGRYTRLAPAVRQDFDIPYMAQLTVGPAWVTLAESQRQQITQAFERYVTAVYAERFDSYSGEKLEVLGEQPTKFGLMVSTRIVKSDGEPVSISYLLVNKSGRWRIGDVYLNGTISELATRRSEFSSILRAQGVNGLIAALNDKALTLVPPRS